MTGNILQCTYVTKMCLRLKLGGGWWKMDRGDLGFSKFSVKWFTNAECWARNSCSNMEQILLGRQQVGMCETGDFLSLEEDTKDGKCKGSRERAYIKHKSKKTSLLFINMAYLSLPSRPHHLIYACCPCVLSFPKPFLSYFPSAASSLQTSLSFIIRDLTQMPYSSLAENGKWTALNLITCTSAIMPWCAAANCSL